MNSTQLGKFIANLRNEKNLTQEELAEKLFIDKRKVSRWECGTSTPEFDMLIKLSEILDVSLYELSICKRLDKESITRKTINRFKSIKDFKKYKLKKKLLFCLLILLGIFFLITTIYTFKHNGTVEIYELKSLDDNYYLEGNYIRTKEYNAFSIKEISVITESRKDNNITFNDCKYEIYDEDSRISYTKTGEIKNINLYKAPYYDEINIDDVLNQTPLLLIKCTNNNGKDFLYEIDIKLVKKYDNKLF